MSKLKGANMLTHSEVHKKILERVPAVRSKEELLGPFDRYRDENSEIYNAKRRQFLDACKTYHKLNQETLMFNKTRLLDDYREALDCGFLKEEEEEKTLEDKVENSQESKDNKVTRGVYLRKRTSRIANQTKHYPDTPCTMEPWFGRYLKLNKFIWAARTTILKNRLLKVLEKLKTVKPEDIKQLETREKSYINVSYAEIFEKFL